MKTSLLRVFLFLILSCSALTSSTLAKDYHDSFFSEVGHTVRTSEDDVMIGKRAGYDVVDLEDGGKIGEIGKPDLPLKMIHLIIPNNFEVESLTIVTSSHEVLAGEFSLFPAQPDQKTDGTTEALWAPEDPRTYNSDSLYPGRLGEISDCGYLAGNHIVTVALYPLQYRPKSKRLFFNTGLDVKLKLESSTKVPSSSLITRRSSQASRLYAGILSEMVDNQGALPIYRSLQSFDYGSSNLHADNVEEYPYLIITSSELIPAFLPLLEWKRKKGVKAAIVGVDSILNTYTGRDDPEKIRNFLIDSYQNGTMWVLLGGDEDVVPVRYLYPTNAFSPPAMTKQHISDLYYSDVDGQWDDDNDGIWGEPGDDSPDVYPDLFVGRAPCSDSAEAASFVEKVLSYERNPGSGSTDYLTSLLWMCSDQMRDWGGGVGQHVLASQYADSNFFQDLSTLIEDPSGSAENPAGPDGQACIETMNQGWGIVSVLAHGMPSGFVAKSNQTNEDPKSWVLTAPGGEDGHGHLPSLSNQGRYGIMYSIACKQSAIDVDKYPVMGNEPCVGELYPFSPNNGGVAFLGYTRWGWVGSSYKLLQKFLEYLFDDSSKHHLGIAEALSRCSYPSYRDLNYGHNLFGDPEMRVWTEIPDTLTAAHPSKVLMGLRTIDIFVSSGGTGVPQATVCLCLNSRIMFLGTTDQNGLLSAEVNLDDVGEMSVVATKSNFIPYEGNITVSITADADDPDKEETIESLDLSQNHPNPFNPVTSIQYSVSSRQTQPADSRRRTADGSFPHITLRIYNILGQKVKTLVDEPKAPRSYEVTWDGKDEKGNEVSSGIYFYTLSTENYQKTRKMILMK